MKLGDLATGLEALLDSEILYWDLEHDYILHVHKALPVKKDAADMLERGQGGLRKKIVEFESEELKRPELTETYDFFFRFGVGVDNLLFAYAKIVFEDSEGLMKAADRLRVNRNTLARTLKRNFQDRPKKTLNRHYEPDYIEKTVGEFHDLTLENMRKCYAYIALEMTRGNIDQASRVTGIDKSTIRKHKGMILMSGTQAKAFQDCFKEGVSYKKLEEWRVVALANKSAEELDISAKSFKTKINEYVSERYDK